MAERLDKIEPLLERLDDRTETVLGHYADLSTQVTNLAGRVDHLGLNGHVPALKQLAEATPALLKLAEASPTIIAGVQRQQRDDVFYEVLRQKAGPIWRKVRFVVWTVIAAVIASFAYWIFNTPHR